MNVTPRGNAPYAGEWDAKGPAHDGSPSAAAATPLTIFIDFDDLSFCYIHTYKFAGPSAQGVSDLKLAGGRKRRFEMRCSLAD